MGITATHTYVILEISKTAYDEIAGKLREAGYDHCFMEDGEIDMHGLAIALEEPPESNSEKFFKIFGSCHD